MFPPEEMVTHFFANRVINIWKLASWSHCCISFCCLL